MSRVIVIAVFFVFATADVNIGLKFAEKIYDECQKSENILKCFKVQALKITNRALRFDKIRLISGISLVRSRNDTADTQLWRPIWDRINFNRFDSNKIDKLLQQSFDAFASSKKLDINFPEVLTEEGRKGGKKVQFGPLLAAIGIKSAIMAVGYTGVMAIAGVAILAGKMALLLCAIMGLKKLVSDKGDKSTTLEIVKHPAHSTSHTHSTSYEDDHLHRSVSSAEDLPERRIQMYRPYYRNEH